MNKEKPEETSQIYNGEIITVEILAKAISNGISKSRYKLSVEEAKLTAEHVLNFFGFSTRIIDNILEPEDRDTFYTLEDLGILSTEREETTLHDGREWRIHYWILNYNKIMKLASGETEYVEDSIEEDPTEVYKELPEDVWASRSK